MRDQLEWKWYSGTNDENFSNGPFDTREQAVAELDGYGGYVVQARKVPLRLSGYFDVDQLLGSAEDVVYDQCNENGDPLFDLTDEQSKDLQDRIRAAIDEWQDAQSRVFVPWAFSETKNLERIEETLQ